MCSYLICRFAAYGISFSLCQSSALISAIAGMVHVDYTVLGGLQRLSTILPDDAEQLKKTPFAVIQVILSQTAQSKMLFCLPIDWVNVNSGDAYLHCRGQGFANSFLRAFGPCKT